MLGREGFPGGAVRLATIVMVTASVVTPPAMAVDNRGMHPGSDDRGTIDLPREILPWRRDIEVRADGALRSASRAFASGRGELGRQRLEELVRWFPGTHAARDGAERLERLRQTALWGGQKRGALGRKGDVRSDDGDAIAISPVAGWQTVVRRGDGELHEALIEAAGDRVFFEAGSASLTKPAQSVLRQQAHWLKAHPQVEFKIIGHADDEGSGASNLRLSHDRAVAVRQHLIHQGVSGNRLHVVSYGDAKPIATCTIQSCAAQNRRVVSEIHLKRQAFIPSR